jgi:hypothetical protein
VVSALATAPWLGGQDVVTLPELNAQQTTFDGKNVRITGIFFQTHIGPLLKDESGQVAARLRFDGLPRPARKQVVNDNLYRKLLDVANSIPDPDQPRLRYQVEMIGLVKVLKKPNYDVYKDGPVEIYPLRVLRITVSG